MIKILIADDHAVVRKGVKQILMDDFPQALCGEAGNAHEVFELVKKEDWDILILDMSLPDKSGLDVLKELKIMKPKLPVFMLTVYPEEEYAVRVLKSGGVGYLTKDSIPEELVKAVVKILKGGKYVSPSLAEKLAYNLDQDTEKPLHETLSDREYQVMLMVASGKSLTEIADSLCISIKSISTYKTRIFEKMGFKSNAELIRYVIDHKLG